MANDLRRWRGPLVTTTGAALAVVVLAWRDPHQSGSWGYCPILLITGHPCPGCGGLRAVNDLAHGRLMAAVGSNALVVLLVLAGMGLLVRWFWRRRLCGQAPMAQFGRITGWSVLVVVSVFEALRLMPGFTGLTP